MIQDSLDKQAKIRRALAWGNFFSGILGLLKYFWIEVTNISSCEEVKLKEFEEKFDRYLGKRAYKIIQNIHEIQVQQEVIASARRQGASCVNPPIPRRIIQERNTHLYNPARPSSDGLIHQDYLGKDIMNDLPDWTAKNPEKYTKRLLREKEMLEEYFPNMSFALRDTTLLIQGRLITINLNTYNVEIEYPSDYPYSPPGANILDEDVVNFVKERGMHDYHHTGVNERNGGIRLCVMRRHDTIGVGWKPEMTGITILNLAAAWLHAYEVKRTTGEWILPT